MGDKLAVKFSATIGGKTYRNGAPPDTPEQPIAVEVEMRDNETPRCSVTVFDAVGDQPFPEFNSTPDPVCNPNVDFQLWAGREDEAIIKVFGGLLIAKKMNYQASTTQFVGLHDAFKLRKKGKVDVLHNLTIGEMLRRKAKEENIILQIDPSVAGDDALNTPVEVFYQGAGGLKSNWDLMYHHIRELGYITTAIKKNVLVLRRNKESGNIIELKRGDDWIISIDLRYEQKRQERSPRRKSHAHEPKPGKFWHRREGNDCGGGKGLRTRPPALPKRKNREHKVPFAKFSVKQVAKRLEQEGREATFTFRFKPEMRNEEIIQLSGFGPQIDGAWQTAAVVHSFGNHPARTVASCWKKQ